ncbi:MULTISPECIES: ABC transporter ATP-binding protein [Corynebacterium]|uniref:ABC transporter ATP-binding protein n=1 Tax=Corynebacterium TaxID=1716 RepID=UPI0008A42951|nr:MULTISPECIES: ABC transporter ATP-binding protein [Corynebacterium]MCT1441908.1 ABC transporter ATP-binding protein [Corynebacterium glucuronolyticum]MCT1563614.1 ABC transporter ATP-binding protein [Corynebacterium glucuronolyticum]OFO47827.1 sugar ABC transporter ATP-binding protein [Corynebacterium sp. HMSC073D01]
MADVVFDHVCIRYPGTEKPTVADLNLHISDGEFLVLVGPSGCGKSTTLRALAGLEKVASGTITIGGTDVTDAEPADRDVAMVFQNYALYPHMTVAKNMGFALSLAKLPQKDIDRKVAEAAELLDLTEFLNRKPKDLSGGQRQRVAMGRAIVREPHVFLMDEPLSNLDAKLRVQTRTQLANLQHRLGTTTVYVTHDQVEAMTMGDRVAVLKDGALQQVAPPRELYDAPANAFVAGFIGSPAMNLIPADIAGMGAVTFGIRPEHLHCTPATAGTSSGFSIPATVSLVEELGSTSYVYAHRDDDPSTPLVARLGGGTTPFRGDRVLLIPEMDRAHYFDRETGNRVTLPRN